MKENLHPIDELFKNGLNDHQEEPPENSWEQINNKLDKEKVIYFGKKYQQLKKIAIALFFLGSLATFYALYLKKQENKIAVAQPARDKNNNLSKNTRESIPSAKTTDELVKQDVSGKINRSTGSDTAQTFSASGIKSENKFNSNPVFKNEDDIRTGKDNLLVLKQPGTTVDNIRRTYRIKLTKTNAPGRKTSALEKQDAVTINKESHNKKLSADLINENINTRLSYITYDGLQAPALGQLLKTNFGKFNSTRNNIAPDRNIKTNTSASVQKNLISLSAFYSADKVSNHLFEDNPGRRDKDDFENSEQNRSSYSAGILLDINLNKNISLGSGIIYSSVSTIIFPKTLYARPDSRGDIKYEFNCSSGYAYLTSKTASNPASGDSIKALSSKTQIQYLTLPVNIKYHFNVGRLSISPGIGMYVNYLIKGSIGTTIVNNNNKENLTGNTINGLKSGYMSGSLGLEVAYRLNRNLSLMVSPNERMAISSINKDTPVKTYPSVFGIYAGIKMNF